MATGWSPSATETSHKGNVNIDPTYGSFNNIWDFEVPHGEIVELRCPHCGISLTEESSSCTVCAAPLFTLHLPKNAIIEACLRKNCFAHRLKLVHADELLKRIFDEQILDAYL